MLDQSNPLSPVMRIRLITKLIGANRKDRRLKVVNRKFTKKGYRLGVKFNVKRKKQ